MDAGKRAERGILALILCAALLLPVCSAASQSAGLPSDVPPDAWYAQYVQTCIDEKLMGTFEGGLFCPEQELSVANLIVLTAQLWSKTAVEDEATESREDNGWLEPASDVWNVETEIPTKGYGVDFACYADALKYVRMEDHGYMGQIEQRIESMGGSVSDIPATRGDLCALWGGNMSAPVYRRNVGHGNGLYDLCVRNMYMTGVMVGTGTGLELERVLTRKEAAAFLARYAHAELRMPDEEVCVTPTERLKQIEVYLAGYGVRFEEYKLKLAEGELWCYELRESDSENADAAQVSQSNRRGRDLQAENEGFQTCRELDHTQITTFLDSAILEKALTWGHYYNAAYAYDGLQWGFTFVFDDDSVWDVQGSNAFPDGWLDLLNKFYGLAGKSLE